jgi:hypothetical protein
MTGVMGKPVPVCEGVLVFVIVCEGDCVRDDV